MINRYTFTGKTIEEATKEATSNLNKPQEKLVIKGKATKKGLFSKKVEIEVMDSREIIEFIKEKLIFITTNMSVETKIEVKERDNTFVFSLYSDNNALLIGKQGRTIDALQTIIRQAVYNEIGVVFNFIIDVSEYKKKNQIRLEKLAKYTAKEVAITKVEAKLEPMNSYERRIIHNALSNSRDVSTISVGEEPNRCVVIKLKGE